MSVHLCVLLPTSGLPPNQPSTGQPTLCRAVRVSQGSSAEDEADGPQPQLPTSSEQLQGVVSSSSQETEPQCPRPALAAFSFLPRTLPHPPFGGVHLRKSKSFLNSGSAPGNPKLSCMQRHPTGRLEPLPTEMMTSPIQGHIHQHSQYSPVPS